jgi:uncharacterized protein involved in tellurium resistance
MVIVDMFGDRFVSRRHPPYATIDGSRKEGDPRSEEHVCLDFSN